MMYPVVIRCIMIYAMIGSYKGEITKNIGNGLLWYAVRAPPLRHV